MKCPKCGTENRFNAIVCDTCGTSLLEAPADEPLDLNRFAPAHSDPISSHEHGRSIHDVPEFESRADKDPDRDSAGSTTEIWEKIRIGAAAAASKCWDVLKAVFGRIGAWLNSLSAWIAGKIRLIANKFDDGDGVVEDDERFRKIVLAVILGLLTVIIVILLSFCGSCSCTSCAPASIAGTWVEASCTYDGYQRSDLILELTADGQLIDRGTSAGQYEFSEEMLTFTINGMEYSGTAATNADEMTVSLHGYSSVSLNLVKISDETGLTAQELAALYPDE